jgi:excisionase family DNA binding protein
MLDMKQDTLPLPNPTDWLTTKAAAWLLGMSTRSVERMVERGVLRAYRPYGAQKEKVPAMFWRPEVNAVVDARTVLAATETARAK